MYDKYVQYMASISYCQWVPFFICRESICIYMRGIKLVMFIDLWPPPATACGGQFLFKCLQTYGLHQLRLVGANFYLNLYPERLCTERLCFSECPTMFYMWYSYFLNGTKAKNLAEISTIHVNVYNFVMFGTK